MRIREYISELNRQEILYTIGAMLLIGTKALGMEESEIIFRVIMLIGFAFIGVKILLDKNSVREWIIIVFSVGFGIFQFFNMGSLGLVILMMLFSGMKQINIKKLFKALAVEYVICFIITITLALFKVVDPNYVSTIKYGTEITRNSLGYAHPNVLHITYVVVMCLVLYTAEYNYRKTCVLLTVFLLIDILVFIFSKSETGLIMSLILIMLWLFTIKSKYYSLEKDFGRLGKNIIYILVFFIMIGFIVIALGMAYLSENSSIILRLYQFSNVIFNQRIIAIAIINYYTGISLFGGMLNTFNGWALDCSYAYALYSYGIIFYVALVISYYGTIRYLIRNKRYMDIVILLTLMIGGVMEPFMFNASIKNLTVFMLGEWAFTKNISKDSII